MFVRVLAYTDSSGLGGAEIALGHVLHALDPAIETGLLVVEQHIGRALALQRPGTPIRVLAAPRGTKDYAALVAHRRAIRAFKPDILHTTHAHPWACGCAELAASLVPGVRVVCVDQLPIVVAMRRSDLAVRRLLARRLHARIAVGERVARSIEAIVGLAPGSVIDVPNGVPPDDRRGSAPRLANEPPVIGALGRLTDQKGFDTLVRALARLPDARLVLVGDGPERPVPRAYSRQPECLRARSHHGLDGRRARLPLGLRCVRVAIEVGGNALAILEAMHAGLPVVASDVGSVAEAVLHGETGLCCAARQRDRARGAPASAACAAAAAKAAGRGRSRPSVRCFTAEAIARRYEATYQTVLSR